MKRACIVFLVAAVSVVLFAMQAVAEGIPGDADHDNRLTGGELNSAVFAYLSGSGTLTLDDLRYAAFVYVNPPQASIMKRSSAALPMSS